MHLFLLYLIFFFIVPAVSFFFFCQYSGHSWKWSGCLLYILFYAVLLVLEQSLPLPGGLYIFLEAGLLSLVGLLFHHSFRASFVYASLITSVLSICSGCLQCLIFWRAASLPPDNTALLYLDSLQWLLTLLTFSVILFQIRRRLPLPVPGGRTAALPLLLIPILFLSLMERTIRDTVYGNLIIWDKQKGLVYPLVEHTEILLLQLFAGICLSASVFSWKKVTGAILLEQQIHAQEIYLQELSARYDKTRSFRHDVKNHLAVIRELLRAQEPAEAEAYLSHLEEAANRLSYPVHTGRRAVDALLGSKLSLAREYCIELQLDLILPKSREIPDMDWCILLANTLDNAFHASLKLPSHLRRTLIKGSQKGNLYLLSVENTCAASDAKLPREGTGLFNIRSTAGKYGGTVRISFPENCFRLDIFLILKECALEKD